VLVVDDTHQGPVADAWEAYRREGRALELGRVEAPYCEDLISPFSNERAWLGGQMKETTSMIIREWAGVLSYGSYI
jgi:hypothetical protein